jgi:trk system potassium uptake protein TrkH
MQPTPPRPRRTAPLPYTDKIRISPVQGLPSPGDLALSEARPKRSPWLSGPWVLIGGFALIVLLGTLLLKLPWASATGKSITWSEAIFTSTSATTVTGLAVLNTANDFSFFGQVVILLLLQVGGVGFIAFSVLLLRIIGRRITLQTRFIVQQTLATSELSGVLTLALYVLGVTLALEAAGAILLWLRWRTVYPDDQALWYAIFHAISAYCNAGFDLFSGTEYGTLFGFGTDWYSLFVLGTLILLGGFGITVMYDLWTTTRDRQWSLNTRITIALTVVLTTVGTAIFWLDPHLHRDVLPESSLLERASASVFTVVSARTAGMTVLPLPELSEASQLVLMLWMFIGGAPASMAGGVSSSTVGVLLFAVLATAKGHAAAVAFGRTLPAETIAKAVAIITVSTLLVAGMTLTLSISMEAPIFSIGFEVISAFANAGYSLDFTGQLDDFGRYLIAFTMFWGRLGPLTIVVALAQSEQPTLVRYPAEPVILG